MLYTYAHNYLISTPPKFANLKAGADFAFPNPTAAAFCRQKGRQGACFVSVINHLIYNT